jgi:hypothetical protein
MHATDASGLLDLWERGFDLSPPQRALALLALAEPDARGEALNALSLGQRDAALLRLRERLFGAALDFVATCPACSGIVESTLDARGLAMDVRAPEPQELALDDRSLRFRVPVLGDLLGLPVDPQAARRALVSRCLESDAPDDLPDHAIAAIGAAMSAADPAADIELALECAHCGERWEAAFDIATFLWREIDAWARRTLREVHALARAYAWREADVLAMSPTRRQIYLELSRA